MTEEIKEEQTVEEAKQEMGDASIKRINIIYKQVKEYFRAVYGNLSSMEFTMIGMDCILAGYQLVSRSNDIDNADVDTRINVMKSVEQTIHNVLDKVYCDPKVVAGMVAQAALESAKRGNLNK